MRTTRREQRGENIVYMERRYSVLTFSLGLLLVTLPSCGSGGDPSARLFDALHRRSEAASGPRPYGSLVELLGNTNWQWHDGTSGPWTRAVVVARVDNVVPGKAFAEEPTAKSDGQVPFDDDNAKWRTVHVEATVETVISGGVSQDAEIVVGFAFGSRMSFDDVRAGFMDMKRALLFLQDTPVFSYDNNVVGTVKDGALLATVGSVGEVSLPALDAEEASELLSRADTVEELLAAARRPGQTIEVTATGERKR